MGISPLRDRRARFFTFSAEYHREPGILPGGVFEHVLEADGITAHFVFHGLVVQDLQRQASGGEDIEKDHLVERVQIPAEVLRDGQMGKLELIFKLDFIF